MEGGEKHDVQYHLSTATRALERAERDMSREIVERMGEYIKSVLSANNIGNMVKEKKKAKQAIDERDIEQSLGPLFEYLNANVSDVYTRWSLTWLTDLVFDILSDVDPRDETTSHGRSLAIHRFHTHVHPHPATLGPTGTQAITLPSLGSGSRHRVQVPPNAQGILQCQRGQHGTRCSPGSTAARTVQGPIDGWAIPRPAHSGSTRTSERGRERLDRTEQWRNGADGQDERRRHLRR